MPRSRLRPEFQPKGRNVRSWEASSRVRRSRRGLGESSRRPRPLPRRNDQLSRIARRTRRIKGSCEWRGGRALRRPRVNQDSVQRDGYRRGESGLDGPDFREIGKGRRARRYWRRGFDSHHCWLLRTNNLTAFGFRTIRQARETCGATRSRSANVQVRLRVLVLFGS